MHLVIYTVRTLLHKVSVFPSELCSTKCHSFHSRTTSSISYPTQSELCSTSVTPSTQECHASHNLHSQNSAPQASLFPFKNVMHLIIYTVRTLLHKASLFPFKNVMHLIIYTVRTLLHKASLFPFKNVMHLIIYTVRTLLHKRHSFHSRTSCTS